MTLKVDNIQNENASEANVVLNSNGSISIPSQIKHVGDDNTLIEFETDTVKLQTGGTARVTVADTTTTVSNKLIGSNAIQAGGDGNNGTAAGIVLNSNGVIHLTHAASGSAVFHTFAQGSNTSNCHILANGSATFNGITLSDNNLVVANGHGINFGAQTGTAATGATTTAELLDHYEEGSWTPNIGGSSSGVTYNIQWGRYTRIGNRVWVEGGLRPSNLNGLTGTANLARIRGLPFNIGNSSSNLTQTGGGAITWYDGSEVSSHSNPMLTGSPQTDQILLFQKTGSATANATPTEFFKVGFRFNFYFSYLVTN